MVDYKTNIQVIALSLRDYFAAQALVGFAANEGPYRITAASAREAYAIADAMLEVRKNG